MPGAAPGTGKYEGVQNDGGHAQVTAQNHSVGRPRQRLAGFGSRPLLNFTERSVNGKPAVSKTATAGSSPACSAVFGTVAKKPRQRSAKPPCAGASPARVSIWGCGEIRITGRSHRPIPGAEPGSSTRFTPRDHLPRVCPRRDRIPARAKGRGFIIGCDAEVSRRRIVNPVQAGSSPVAAANLLRGRRTVRQQVVNLSAVGSNPTPAEICAPVA